LPLLVLAAIPDLLPASRRRGAGAGIMTFAHALQQNGFHLVQGCLVSLHRCRHAEGKDGFVADIMKAAVSQLLR
jgi:hypothetical protein